MATQLLVICSWADADATTGFVGILFDDVTGLVSGVRYQNATTAPHKIQVTAVAPFSPTFDQTWMVAANVALTDVTTFGPGTLITTLGVTLTKVTRIIPGGTHVGWLLPAGVTIFCGSG